MAAAFIQFHTQDSVTEAPIGGAFLSARAIFGPWQAVTNACGDFFTPPPGLAPGHYDVTVTAPGYDERTIPMNLGDCGQVLIGLTASAAVLPPIPTRAQVCGLRVSLAGLTYRTQQYGDFPAWWYGLLNAQDRASARATHRAAGDTHITIPISEAYKEAGTLWSDALKNGYDYTQDITTFRAILTETIAAGFFIDCPLAGDGLGAGPGYNDPVGNTYGQQWLMDNLARIIAGLKGDGSAANPDLTPYILFRPGWDAVFYGWGVPGEVPDLQPTRVKDFGALFRSLLPHGYLSIEHTPGNIPCGEGGSDYAPGGLMRAYDTILSEFNTVHEDSCWQVVGRMVSPYNWPPDQPSGDDPHPPFYLAPGTERGPYFYVAFEPTVGGVYQWCRGQCSEADVQATRQYLRNLGCMLTG